MKKKTALLLFCIAHAAFIFLYVHKQGKIVKTSYVLQKMQTQITTLLAQKSRLLYALENLQQPDILYTTAINEHHFLPIQLKNISHLPCLHKKS